MQSVPSPTSRSVPASLAAVIMLVGLGLIYWSLVGLGLLRSSTTPAPVPA